MAPSFRSAPRSTACRGQFFSHTTPRFCGEVFDMFPLVVLFFCSNAAPISWKKLKGPASCHQKADQNNLPYSDRSPARVLRKRQSNPSGLGHRRCATSELAPCVVCWLSRGSSPQLAFQRAWHAAEGPVGARPSAGLRPSC